MWIAAIFFALLGWSSLGMAAQKPVLHFSINESWTMPLVDFSGKDETHAGILPDLYHALAKRIDRPASLISLPRRRVQQGVENGLIDVRCYVTPDWVRESHYRYIWSLPFMVQRDLLVGRQGQPSSAPESLPHGTRIGTVLGYQYPRLDPLFASGQLLREDVRTQEQLLAMLQSDRFDYAMSSEQSLAWFNRQHPAQQKLIEVAEISLDEVSCLVRDTPDIPTMALLRALVRMRLDGTFEKILARYR